VNIEVSDVRKVAGSIVNGSLVTYLLGVVLTCFAISALLSGASAQVGECHYRFRDRQNTPQVDQTFNQHPADSVAYICLDNSGKVTRYDTASLVRTRGTGTCSFVRTPLLPKQNPTLLFMSVAAGSCPEDRERYVYVDGVSEGVFHSIMNFVESLRSGAIFDAALRTAQVADDLERGQLESIKALIVRSSGDDLQIASVELRTAIFVGDLSGYSVAFLRKGSPPQSPQWILDIDLTNEGFKVLRVGVRYF
jgi:hypothetical protein